MLPQGLLGLGLVLLFNHTVTASDSLLLESYASVQGVLEVDGLAGYENHAEIIQNGELNSIELLMAGQRNYIHIEQVGDSNVVAGLNGQQPFTMHGTNSRVWIEQIGSMNTVLGAQLSSNSSISVTQHGSGNLAIINQF